VHPRHVGFKRQTAKGTIVVEAEEQRDSAICEEQVSFDVPGEYPSLS
jgi:hypothetical protein